MRACARHKTVLAAAIVIWGTLVCVCSPAVAQSVLVPDVLGLQQGVAEPTIISAGLTVGNVTYQQSFVIPVGQVMSQTPLAGTGVLVGTPVNLVVSAGVVVAIVPSIVGLTRADAVAAITAAGLVVGTVIEQISTSYPPGTVLSQNPPPGTSVAPGSAVSYSVSIGGGTVAVPTLVGLQRTAAEAAIVAAGLIVGPVTTQTSPVIPIGQVIGQTPGAGTVVTLGTQVRLTVSSGQGFVLAPNLVGMSQTGASAALNAAGLALGTVTLRSSPTIPAGTVLSQSPVAGAAVAPGSAVNVVVSSGLTQTPVPNVIGLTLVAAEQAILAAGLSVGTVTQQTNPAVPAGQVLQQSPAPGILVAPGTNVNLVVSSGSSLVTVPNVIGLSLGAAQFAINNAGLVLGAVTEQPSGTAAPGTVLVQVPPAGVAAPVGSSVDLVIASVLAQVVAPNVVGLQESAAESALIAAGLVVGTRLRQPSNTVPAGAVISQSPTAGSLVAQGAAINLVISTGANQTIVPNVVGLQSTAAQAAIVSAGLIVGTITLRTNPIIPVGQVISQDPPGGNTVAVGTAVNLVVSSGPTSVFVPNVVGMTLSAAQTALVNAGLAVGTIANQPSTTAPAGSVISQTPAANTAVAPGSTVNLVVSTGAGQVSVPNVVGLQRTAAGTVLVSAGLSVGTITTQFTTTVPAGQVLQQTPAAGMIVTLGTAVNLVVATRTRTVLVPNVVDLPLQAAQTTLTSAGLAVGTVTQRASSTVVAGNVISQSPGAGSEVAEGTAVSLVVSTGPVQTAVPNVVGLTLTQARLSITLAGFLVGNVVAQESTLPVNQVIAQTPAAGTLATPGTEVDLFISAGVSPAIVPNLIGLARTSAQQILELAGFTLGLVTLRPSPSIPEGLVLEQQPAPGAFAPGGSAINLVVSEGVVLVQVPNVVGLQLEQARTLILNARLEAGTVTQQQSQQAAGTVLSQAPAAGVNTSAGAVVNLVISQGTATLARPLNLTASQGAFSAWVRLSWDAVEGATQYQVLRSATTDETQAVDLATVAETTYDDTSALAPNVFQQSAGCFAPPEEVVEYNNHYYWVQALSADAESELTGPALGYRGLAAPKGLDLARIKALPSSGRSGGLSHAQPGDTLAVRLSSRDGIDAASVWGLVAIDDGAEQGGVQWKPLPGSGGRDGWVMYTPPEPFQPGQTVRFRAGAVTLTGFEVLETSEFLISASAPPATSGDLWQPRYSAADGGLDPFAADEVHVRAAVLAGLPVLPEAVGLAYALEPQQVYHAPQRVWLPAPEPFDPEELEPYVVVPGAAGPQWWPAGRVLGFLEPGETARVEAAGVTWIGVVARHGAVVCIGKKLPEPRDAGGNGLTDDVVLGGVAMMALAAAVFASRDALKGRWKGQK